MYTVSYNGVDYVITEEEYQELVNGERTKKDMFG